MARPTARKAPRRQMTQETVCPTNTRPDEIRWASSNRIGIYTRVSRVDLKAEGSTLGGETGERKCPLAASSRRPVLRSEQYREPRLLSALLHIILHELFRVLFQNVINLIHELINILLEFLAGLDNLRIRLDLLLRLHIPFRLGSPLLFPHTSTSYSDGPLRACPLLVRILLVPRSVKPAPGPRFAGSLPH